MSKQPPLAPTASTIGPCPTVIQVSRTPRHWKFTQHLRTTRLVCTDAKQLPNEAKLFQGLVGFFYQQLILPTQIYFRFHSICYLCRHLLSLQPVVRCAYVNVLYWVTGKLKYRRHLGVLEKIGIQDRDHSAFWKITEVYVFFFECQCFPASF